MLLKFALAFSALSVALCAGECPCKEAIFRIKKDINEPGVKMGLSRFIEANFTSGFKVLNYIQVKKCFPTFFWNPSIEMLLLGQTDPRAAARQRR